MDRDIDPDPIQSLFNDSRSTEPRALLTQLILVSALSVRVFTRYTMKTLNLPQLIIMFLFDLLRPTNKVSYMLFILHTCSNHRHGSMFTNQRQYTIPPTNNHLVYRLLSGVGYLPFSGPTKETSSTGLVLMQ